MEALGLLAVEAVVGLDLNRVHPKLRTIARNLPRVAKANGFQVRITSGYRSRSVQAKLYRDYLNGTALYPVNPPGTSLHEKGMALDILSTNQNALASLLTSIGLTWGGPSDPIHFQIGQNSALGASRTQNLPQVNTIPQRESFGTSFLKSAEKIASWFLPF